MFWKEFYCISGSRSSCFENVGITATIVVHCWSYVEFSDPMVSPCPQSCWCLCATIRYPNDTSGVLLESKLLYILLYAAFFGLILEGLSILKVNTAMPIIISHWFLGNQSNATSIQNGFKVVFERFNRPLCGEGPVASW